MRRISHRHLLWPLLASTSLLAGCITGNSPPAPETVLLPDSFAAPVATTEQVEDIAGLLPVNDPGFIALRDTALQTAPDLAAALARINIARAGLRGAGAARLPNVTGQANVTQQRINPAQFGGVGGDDAPGGFAIQQDQTIFSTSIDASWDADLFGRLKAAQRAATLRLDASNADAAATRLALTADIALNVTDYRAVAARRSVIDAEIADLQGQEALTAQRAKAGLVPEFDTVRAQSLLRRAESRRAPLVAEEGAILARLATLTGQSVQQVQAQLGEGGALALTGIAKPALTVPSTLLRARPDVLAAEYRLAAADADLASAVREQYPTFSIQASLGLIALALGDLFSDDAIIGSVVGGATVPLLDFGRIGARIDQREAEAALAFADYRRILFTALGDVEASLVAVDAADAETASLQQQAVTDRDAAKLADIRYRNGLDDFLTVIDAQRNANASAEALVISQANAQRQRIALYRAIGGEPQIATETADATQAREAP
ncbi:efflux transporter outer membrane subunit [Alterisphingorhabdus coralli]|uniref:Efflux transporter outer membrane subunit n=1 Tax=Alterisphingorhabdus coralli TaxID=3071408 RepID=A0AA97F7K9_9SPHN|nr:efflux transporter outer membrane subunit [Parasphingorhabdus sp. SCSIO 66989]WOE74737.1 efflux transporter outer membrane subunit [Parasphingorhabdus sp. SCSIO 66989]